MLKADDFFLLKTYDSLDKSAKEGLQALLDIIALLFIGHTLMEQFRIFWEQSTIEKATGFLVRWFWDVFESELELLIKVGRTLLGHAEGIVNCFKHRISNGKIEGINNKIKTFHVKLMGFGIWNSLSYDFFIHMNRSTY